MKMKNYDRTDSLRMLVILVMMAMMAIMAMMSMMAMKTKTMMVMMLKTMMVMMLMVSQIALVSPLEWCHCQCCSVPTLLRFIVPRCTTFYIVPHSTLYHVLQVHGTTLYKYIVPHCQCCAVLLVTHCGLYYTTLHCTTLNHTVLHCIHIVPHCSVLHLHHTALH